MSSVKLFCIRRVFEHTLLHAHAGGGGDSERSYYFKNAANDREEKQLPVAAAAAADAHQFAIAKNNAWIDGSRCDYTSNVAHCY